MLAEDLAGEDLADVLDLHADAHGVVGAGPVHARTGRRNCAGWPRRSDLDDLAVADLTAADQRAKFEQIGQSRLVVTNAVALDASTG